MSELKHIAVSQWIHKNVFLSYNKGGPTLEVKGDVGVSTQTHFTNILDVDTQKAYIINKIVEMGEFFAISSANIETMKTSLLNRKGYTAMSEGNLDYYVIRSVVGKSFFLNSNGEIFDLYDKPSRDMSSLIDLKEKIMERISMNSLLDNSPHTLPACKKALEIVESKITMLEEKKGLEEILPIKSPASNQGNNSSNGSNNNSAKI